MTRPLEFADAREACLRAVDRAFLELRVVAADPCWCNTDYPKYRQACDKLHDLLESLARLNAAEAEAWDLYNKTVTLAAAPVPVIP